ncbi:MAG: monovalent cation/H+ antiporter complex subunit F [Verrucomicrobiota bacterium]
MNEMIQIEPIIVRIAYAIIIAALLLTSWKLFKGPGIFERIIALDLIAALVICLSGLLVIETGKTVFLDVALCVAVVTFLSTVAFCRYLERVRDHS